MAGSTGMRPSGVAPPTLDCGGRLLALDRPRVMGVLNITPDSFSDGGQFLEPDAAMRQAERMVAEGVDIIDIGGESTRPGAVEVSVQQELDRVMPMLERLLAAFPVPVSIDTSKADVIREAASAGAGMINDVMALRREGSMDAAAQSGLPVCLMHMQGEPRTMQHSPAYDDVVGEVIAFLGERVAACTAAGISRGRLLLDPGFGFGKSLGHNYRLLRELGRFVAMGLPVMVGLSRKSMLGRVIDKPADQRLFASVAAASVAAQAGVRILRVHDVGPTVDAIRIVEATRDPESLAT